MGGFLPSGGGSGAPPTAAQVSYDNSESGLSASDVQEAIDELAEGTGNAFIGARGYRTTNFIVAADTVTPMPVEVLSFNIGDCVNLAAQPSRFVAVEAGVYLFGGSVVCVLDELELYVRVNGEGSLISAGMCDAGDPNGIVSTVLQLAANDYAELILYSAGGGEAGAFGENTGAWMSRLS